ncbi:PorT family protein [Parabacteroides sp. TM07-1AC]|uniref:porin family protein n=2 Tax=Parabacteroides TaxID=375288 RepID=UPI000EFEECB7|nr:porin family protein [Parabacteroides sp. TM07-1AC]RHU23277.1 PorT family protein [Parabacteroides sp. TM07-1AC]
MRKLILMMLSVWMIGGMASAQSRWSLTPEAGMTAVQRVGYGTWKPGLKVGASIGYQFKPEWIGLKTGLFYTNRGYDIDGLYNQWSSEEAVELRVENGSLKQHFLQLPVMADFSWKVKNVRMHLGVGMYAGLAISQSWSWGAWGYTIPTPETKMSYAGANSYGDIEHGYNHDNNPFRDMNSFDWGLTTSFGIEVQNWVVNVGYELSLGDEGPNYKQSYGSLGSSYTVRSIGSNYNTLSLSVGYKFKLGK